MNSFVFRLPQTIIRAFGLIDLPSLQYFQAPINNPELNTKIIESIKKMNHDLLRSINSEDIKIINLEDGLQRLLSPALLSPALIESNLIHKHHHLFKAIPERYLVPYASGVYNPKYSDIKNIRGFLKCLRDSWNYKKMTSPKGVLDWASMILGDENDKYLPWFWERTRLHLDIYQKRIKSAENFLSDKSEYIGKIRAASNPIIIQPTRSLENDTYLKVVNDYYTKSLKFRAMVDSHEVTIFIKPHRSEVLYEQIPLKQRFRGHEVYYPDNLYDFYIPSEILLNINSRVTLVSEVSSSVFNHFINKNIVIKNVLTTGLFKQYGLIAHRFNSINSSID